MVSKYELIKVLNLSAVSLKETEQKQEFVVVVVVVVRGAFRPVSSSWY